MVVVMMMAFLFGFRVLSVEIINDDFAVVPGPFAGGSPGAVVGVTDASAGARTGRLWWFLLIGLVQVIPRLAVRFVQGAGSFTAGIQSGGRWQCVGRLSAAPVAPIVAKAETDLSNQLRSNRSPVMESNSLSYQYD